MDASKRIQLILDTAAELFVEVSYDKTTIGDIANSIGLHRSLIYVHFKSKESLLEALIAREISKYGRVWLEYIETDPKGGSIGSVYRGTLEALKQTPFLAAIVSSDEAIFGKYLQKPDNILANLQTPNLTQSFLEAMQEANAIRRDVDLEAVAYIMDALSANIVSSKPTNGTSLPPYEILLDTIAEMLDRMLMPEDIGDIEVGRAAIRRFAKTAKEHLAQFQQMEIDRELQ